ncbi:sensor histidine kinase [Galbibacter mesophilus]|uniref:sensor histidine kinase n=1 Tax=Galbibacter mesophilus TaxID=379069 RepID=UPI00191F6794|nr:HAMP domain-containing sensor histidine kinase [Galbibacter mesophilus]MCM5664089.1 HAMP domain-containing histidine kinase [Galbibacter mesophilus]
MGSTEEALRERIKELTCLYEVSSIINNAYEEQMEEVLRAITLSLKKGFQFPEDTEMMIKTSVGSAATKKVKKDFLIQSEIKVFNKPDGNVCAVLTDKTKGFLDEEQQLLDSVALKIGNLLERLELKRNEESLKRQMQHADRLAIVGEITAGIAHELNTPLANILGFAELLKADLQEHSSLVGDVDKIIQNAIFSREVVKKLMFFACEMPKEMQEVNIVPHLTNSIELLVPTFRKEGVKHVLEIDKEEIWLKVDTIQLTQIVFNLVINAIYFTPSGGKVTIQVEDTSSNVTIKVKDEGPGLSKEALSKVFEPFYTTKPTGEGSGLGLSVVHGIVTSHKGSLTVQNNKNKGAIFTVTIPK